ncbi:hypothetical protein GGI43DRAFT_109893 [Trichoderma evansii]
MQSEGLCTTHAYMYDDVHCMDAELGAVKGAKSSVGYWYRVCSSLCASCNTSTQTRTGVDFCSTAGPSKSRLRQRSCCPLHAHRCTKTSAYMVHEYSELAALLLAAVAVSRTRPAAARWRQTISATPGKLKSPCCLFPPDFLFSILAPRLLVPTPHLSPSHISLLSCPSDRPRAKLRPHRPLPPRGSIVCHYNTHRRTKMVSPVATGCMSVANVLAVPDTHRTLTKSVIERHLLASVDHLALAPLLDINAETSSSSCSR